MDKFGLTLFTLIEDAALIAWLVLVRAGQQIGGVATLIVGFFAEHFIAYNVKRNKRLLLQDDMPKKKILLNAIVETIVWGGWLLLWDFPPFTFSIFGVGIPLVAILFVYPALFVEHSMTDAIFKKKSLLVLKNWRNPKTIGFSIIEGTGCNVWLGLVGAGQPILGAAVLVVFQYVEHRKAIELGRATA